MPSLWLILRRGTKRGLLSAVRQPGWATSVASLLGVLFLGQILVLLFVGMHAGLVLLKEQTDIRLEVLPEATDTQIQDFIQDLRGLPYVEDLVYVTREAAYERERRRDPELISFLSTFGIENPFPETIGVRLQSLGDYPALSEFLQQAAFTQTIDPKFLTKTTDQETQIYRLMDIVSAARTFLLIVVGLLVIALVCIVIELVRRRVLLKREELFVEQLVGATPLSIFVPFGVEMAVLLFAALLLSVLLAILCLVVVPLLVPALAPGGLFSSWTETLASVLRSLLPWIIAGELFSLPLVAAFGTAFGLLPKLKMSTLGMG